MNLETNHLSEGSVFKTLLTFSLPFLAVSFIQGLYGAADTLVIGWFANDAALSAVSVGSVVMLLVTNFLVGISTGGTVVVGYYFGAGKHEETRDSIAAMFALFIMVSAVLTGIMLACSRDVLRLMRTPAAAFDMAADYVSVCSLGIVFTIGFNIVSAILRGQGNSKTPFVLITVSCVLNLALDYFFVKVMDMGPTGAAAATVTAQALSFALSVLYLYRTRFFTVYRVSHRYKRDRLKEIVKIGLSVSMMETLIHVSFLLISALINTRGISASAAAGISNKFEAFAMLPASAFAAAISAFAAQNMGAGKPKRAVKGLMLGIVCSFALGALFFGIVQFWPSFIFRLFNADQDVVRVGTGFIRAYSIDYLLVAFTFCLNGFLNGCGKATFCMLNGVIMTIGVRVPAAFLFGAQGGSLFGIGLAFPIASFFTLITSIIYIKTGKWKTGLISAGAEEKPTEKGVAQR